MIVRHFSRPDILLYAAREGDKSPYWLISISDPNREDIEIDDPKCLKILHLKFSDVGYEAGSWSKAILTAHNIKACTMDQAMEIARFVKDFADTEHPDVTDLLVHCEGGISRSTGIADAIATVLGATWIKKHDSVPNVYVRQLVTEALRSLHDS